ncbi:MAG: transcription termination factor Rho, partial [Lachnospiraceae bacterium]|nr:transcription termination factor Rho [Lachnospiraceae bacterium]
MKEKYESLPLMELRELAKVRGIKGISLLRKPQLVQLMLKEDEKLEHESSVQESPPQEFTEQVERAKQSTERTAQPTERTTQSAERVAQPTERSTQSAERTAQPTERSTQSAERATQSTDRATQTERTERPTQSKTNRSNEVYDEYHYPKDLDSGEEASGILEVMPDGYGFIRCENYLPGENDVYVAPSQIRRFGLKTGDVLRGNKRMKTQQEKFSALLFVRTINGYTLEESNKRIPFEDMTPIFPDKRVKLETPGCSIAMRVMDLLSPVGKGQRGMIVSPPKAGKTTLLKDVARSILRTNPQMHMIILLIDERP